MGKSNRLSERQQGILQHIANYTRKNRRPPTIREIREAEHISSVSVVAYNLNQLAEKGLLIKDKEVARGLSLTRQARELLGESEEQALLRVPLVGNIVAGEPINVGNENFATYDEEDMVDLAASMLPRNEKNLFALRVSGDSMIDAMVNDGDLVILKPQETADEGDMVAVWLLDQDTTTLKHFFREGKRIRLQPANPTMGPIYADPSNVQIQGKVVMVVRDRP